MNWPLLQNSLLVAGTTTALAVGFGLVAALWLAALEARWRNVFLALAIVALALPPFLVTNCWISLLGETGAWRAWLPLKIYSLGGTVWILSLLLWPITALLALSGWRRLEAAQLEADPALSGFALVRVLLLPMARGELALAALVTFVLALNNFAVPAILQTKVMPDALWIQFSTTFFQKPDGTFDLAGLIRVAFLLVVVPLALLALFWRRGIAWPRLQGAVPARIFRRQLGKDWVSGCGLFALALCGVSVALPLMQIAMAKRTWVELAGAVEAGTNAIWNSLWFATAAAAVVVALALAISAGLLNRRDARNAEKNNHSGFSAFITAIRLIPWLCFFVPGVLIGIALIKIFNRPALVAIYQSAGIVLLAFVLRYFALGWTAARQAVGSVDSDLTDVARLEGATRWQMLRHVLWPQIAPQVLAAWYVVYLLCLWDVESIVLVQPPGGETLALKIFNLLHYGHNAQVNALCLALLAVAVAPLVGWCAWKELSGAGRNASKISNPQIPQYPKLHLGSWVFGYLGIWVLICCLCSGCSPPTTNSEAALSSKFFERAEVIGSRGVGIGEFNKPRSVAVDSQDNVYAVDMTGRVQKFSAAGKFILDWQMPQTDLGKPKGMGRDRAGNIIVVEPHYQRLNHFTPEGKLVAQWGCKGTNEGCFMLPRSVAVNSRGEVFVSEYMGAERVQKFRVPSSEFRVGGEHSTSNIQHSASNESPLSPSAGERENHSPSLVNTAAAQLLGIIGKAGTGPGEFNRAEGICVDAQDRLYVADSCNHRIQIFSSDGKFIREYGKAGTGPGQLSYPYDIAVDARGYQFVCEFGNSRIQVFDTNCQPVEIIGRAGAAPGQFNNPWAVALDSRGNLYVADALNHRVQKLIRRMGLMGRMVTRQTQQ